MAAHPVLTPSQQLLDANFLLRVVSTVLLLSGAAVFGYFYHGRPAIDTSDRPQVTDWRLYPLVDWYLKISTLIIAILATYSDHPALGKAHHSPLISLFGLLLLGLALLLFALAMRTLDTQFSPAHRSHVPSRIIRSGPYRFIRHPIYTSNLILLVGMFFFSGSLWMLVNLVILIAYYVPTILVEEASIKNHFPEYREYASQTGRFFPKFR